MQSAGIFASPNLRAGLKASASNLAIKKLQRFLRFESTKAMFIIENRIEIEAWSNYVNEGTIGGFFMTLRHTPRSFDGAFLFVCVDGMDCRAYISILDYFSSLIYDPFHFYSL